MIKFLDLISPLQINANLDLIYLAQYTNDQFDFLFSFTEFEFQAFKIQSKTGDIKLDDLDLKQNN